MIEEGESVDIKRSGSKIKQSPYNSNVPVYVDKAKKISYKGVQYFYSVNKPQNYFCTGNCREIIKKLSFKDQENFETHKHKGKTYRHYKNVRMINFFDRYGNDVSYDLAMKLHKVLSNKDK